MKTRAVTILVCLVIGMIAGILTGGGFIHHLLSLLLGVYLGIPLLVISLIAIGVSLKKDRDGDSANRGSNFFVCYLTLIGAFYLAGKGIFAYREHEVREFVTSTLPLLDDYRSTQGRYPKTLLEIGIEDQPYYFGGLRGYSSDGHSFTFYYEDPDSIMGGLMLTNRHREWQIAD